MTKFIRLPKPRDPLQALIDARIAARKAAERDRQSKAPYRVVAVIRAVTAAMRAGGR